MPSTGDLACNPGMCPDWGLNQWPFGLQPALNPLSYTSQGSFYFILFFLNILNVYFNKYKVYKQLGKLGEELTKIHKLWEVISAHLNFLYSFFVYRVFIKVV